MATETPAKSGDRTINAIRRAIPQVRLCGSGGELLAEGLTRYLEGRPLGTTFEEALGIRDWWLNEGELPVVIRRRLLGELAGLFTSMRAMAVAAQRYERRCWPRDEHRSEPPARSEAEVLFWRLHRNACPGAKWPISAKQIGRQLSSHNGTPAALKCPAHSAQIEIARKGGDIAARYVEQIRS